MAQKKVFHLRRDRKTPPSPKRINAVSVSLGMEPPPPKGNGDCGEFIATFVWMVKVEVTALPFGVTVEGEKLHVLAAGRPEQAKLTIWLNPFCGVTVMVVIPD